MRTLASELGLQIEHLTSRPRIYADANIPAGVVTFMRDRLGWDALFVIEQDDLRRASDAEHYRLARQLRRTLVSLDHDFIDERRFPSGESGGVIVLSAPNEEGLNTELTRVDRAFFGGRGHRPRGRHTASPLVGRKVEIHPDWSGPVSGGARSKSSARRAVTSTLLS